MKRFTLLLATALLGSSPIAAFAKDAAPATANHAVGPQYDTTHVYVSPDDFDRFVASLIATFGGTATKQGVFTVTPTESKTMSQLVLTPAGSLSVFGFKTPIPYPFGTERTGYLVDDMDQAVAAAVKNGAVRVVDTFPDPIGRDAVVQWPGGVNMQLYWHTTRPSYPTLSTIPENRIYLTADVADAFVKHWLAFSGGRITADDRSAPGAEIGQPGKTYRRTAITSGFGRMTVMVSDGQIGWPYGREVTGYEVADLPQTLAKGSAVGVETLVAPHADGNRQSAMVRFPGGYIAEIHSPVGR